MEKTLFEQFKEENASIYIPNYSETISEHLGSYIDWLEKKLTSLPVSPNVRKVEDWDEVWERYKTETHNDTWIMDFLKRNYSLPVSPTELPKDWQTQRMTRYLNDYETRREREIFIAGTDWILSLFNTPSESRKPTDAVKNKLAEEYSEGKSSSSVFKEQHKKDFIAGFESALSITHSERKTSERVEECGLVHFLNWYQSDDAMRGKPEKLTSIVRRYIYSLPYSPPMEKQISEVEAVEFAKWIRKQNNELLEHYTEEQQYTLFLED